MKKKELTKSDAVQSYILMCLSIVGIIVGGLLALSIIKFSEDSVFPSVPFGTILLVIGIFSLFYSIYIILKVKKAKK